MLLMTNWLVRRFIKDCEDISRAEVRTAYGTLAGIVGMVCNIILFLVKFIAGLLSGSAAIISDAVNNLSDFISCTLTLAGSRMAARPADQDHPFGHGRVEYITSLAGVALIFSAAFELLLKGIGQLRHPSAIFITPVMMGILILTIGVKFWMSRFNRTLGERLDHTGLKTAAADSMNDVLTTSLTILAVIGSVVFPTIPLDGIAAVVMAGYIAYNGYQLCTGILAKLIGTSIDEELMDKIQHILLEEPEIQGVHDLILHDYGPGNRMGSVHVEVNGDLLLKEAHEIIDRCERKVETLTHVVLTIHPDPLELDEEALDIRQRITAILAELDPELSLHDFHLVARGQEKIAEFDLKIPYTSKATNAELLGAINTRLSRQIEHVRCGITFDRGYSSEYAE